LVFIRWCNRWKKNTRQLVVSYYLKFIFAYFLDIIASNNSASVSTEAVATHVLLAFHMLFLNILLLNLLIAVFAYVYQ
jgi:hypothetical protein